MNIKKIIKKVDLPPFYQMILKFLFPKSNHLKVLDLGCGKGIAGELFNSNKNHKFTGIDIFNPYIKICSNNGFYNKVIRADLTKIKLDKKSFDVVLLLQVLEHMDKNDALKVLQQSISAAKAAVLISLPNGKCLQEEYEDNKFNIHKSVWRHTDLQKIGFRVYGQGFRPIFGTRSYGAGKKASLWQKILVPLSSFLLFPIIYFVPSTGAQLIAIKYIK